MNPGYLALLLVSMLIILLLSGWRNVIFPETSAKTVALFIAGWLVGHWITVSVGGIRINMSFAAELLFTACLLKAVGSRRRAAHLLSLGVILAAFHFLLMEIYRVNPFLPAFGIVVDAALSLSALTIVLNRHPYQQLFVLSVALIAGETSFAYLHRDEVPFVPGNAEFSDKWWLTLFVARTATIVIETARRIGRRKVHSWTNHIFRKDENRS